MKADGLGSLGLPVAKTPAILVNYLIGIHNIQASMSLWPK
jgi:hypothetical protein